MVFPARRLALGLGATALSLSACGPAISANVDFETVAPPTQSAASVVAQPSGVKKVDPDQRLVVKAQDGQLSTVTVIGPKGPMKGSLSADGTVWTAKKRTLDFGATYTVQATAIDSRGITTSSTDQIRTKEPKAFFGGAVLPDAGSTVGAGTPITVVFDHAIKNKADIERALVVHTPTPIEGAWSWNGATSVQFRPKDYWPGNIDVTVDLNLKGIQSERGVFGKADTSSTFSIGPSMVTKVNAKTHTAKVYRNGKKVRTIPVTTGKAGFETRSGTVLIVSKERTRIMDAATGGTAKTDPEYYRLEVEYAMRITYSGEFLHAAPWSVGSQGFANVSHGCIGMSTSNAQWLYEHSEPGDVVEITGTPNPQNLGNGITVWTETWDEWLKGSKNGSVMTVPPANDVSTTEPTTPTIPTTPTPGPTAPSAPASPGTSTTDPLQPTDPNAVLTQQTAFLR